MEQQEKNRVESKRMDSRKEQKSEAERNRTEQSRTESRMENRIEKQKNGIVELSRMEQHGADSSRAEW